MRTLFFIVILLHGAIHLMGFVKAFGLAEINELTMPISSIWGTLWLAACLIFTTSGILWFRNSDLWWIIGIIGVILSQILILAFWQDARFGTIPNLIILAVISIGFLWNSAPVENAQTAINSLEQRYDLSVDHTTFQLISPFNIQIDPMERLLLINIEKDPDSIYIGFEPQVFDDEINGTGMLVIAWRVDGKVDVYHQPGLNPDHDKYDIVGKGLATMAERQMNSAFFEISEKGVQAEITFIDMNDRKIELFVEERSIRERKPFGLLAPMGDTASNPSALPLVLLHDFYFVRRGNSDLNVKIDGRSHKPDKLSLPLDFTRMYFARYSPDPLIVTLNPEFSGTIDPLPDPVHTTITTDDTRYELHFNNSIPEIASLSRTHKTHTVTMTFSPAFPNLDAFNGEAAEGSFEITGDSTTGKILGEYKVRNINGKLQLEMIPSGGWIPNETKLSLRFLYRVASIFTTWPKTYRWQAELERVHKSEFRINSNWERIQTDEKE